MKCVIFLVRWQTKQCMKLRTTKGSTLTGILGERKRKRDMAAFTPTAKGSRFQFFGQMTISREASAQVARAAGDIAFPWKAVMPSNIYKWLETVSKAHNCKEEFLFIGAMAATTAIMGPLTHDKVRDTYLEPMSLYAICIADPGSGSRRHLASLSVNLLLAWCRKRSAKWWWMTTPSKVSSSIWQTGRGTVW